MADIKTKVRGAVKTLDKSVVQAQKFKNNIVTAKEKMNEYTQEANENPENFASIKVQDSINYSTRKGAENFILMEKNQYKKQKKI